NRAANPAAVTVLSGPQVRSWRLGNWRRLAMCVRGGCSQATSVAPSTESPRFSWLALHRYMLHCSHGTPRFHRQVHVVYPRATASVANVLLPSQHMMITSLVAKFARPSHLIAILPCFFTTAHISRMKWSARSLSFFRPCLVMNAL